MKSLLFLAIFVFGCNKGQNEVPEKEKKLFIPCNEKVVSASYGGGEIGHYAVLTRPMREGEVPETYTLRIDSGFIPNFEFEECKK